MRKTAAVLIALAFALAATAQQVRQCIPAEVLNGLVFLGRSESKVSVLRGQAGFMREVKVPAALTLIGTGVREAGMTSVAYRTSLGADKAHAAILAALGAEGWVEEPDPYTATTFSVAGSPKETTLCRGGARRHLLVSEVAGVRYVHLMTFDAARPRPCNADPAGSSAMELAAGARAPRFQLPAGTSPAQGFRSGGGGGSDSLYTNTTRIVINQGLVELAEHVAVQMEDQGWRMDARWSGTGSAGSTWSRDNDGVPAWGTLEIVRISEATYDIEFTAALPQ